MNAIDLLQKQLTNVNAVFHSLVEDLTPQEWLTRPAPRENMLGFTIWHLPRTQDAFVQTWIRGVPEIAHTERWRHWQSLRPLGAGIGITLDEADEIARIVKPADVLEYADAVTNEINTWLANSNDSVLEQVLNVRQNLKAFPEYQTPGFVEEVSNLYDLHVWGILMRPWHGHIHRHLGEIEIVKQILRAQL